MNAHRRRLTMASAALSIASIGGLASTQAVAAGGAVDESIVWVDVQWDATVAVPFDAGTENRSVTVTYACTGFFVDPQGAVATAGHCLEEDRGIEENILEELLAELADEGYETPSVGEIDWEVESLEQSVYVGQPAGIEAGPLSDRDPIPADVVAFQPFEDGDNALLSADIPAAVDPLVVASTRPGVTDEITAIGFPGSVAQVTDPSQQPPSYKQGSVSSITRTREGEPVIEIDAAVSEGMSGGPAVNTEGEVVGINSFRIAGEAQPFNFITDTEAMREFFGANGVELTTTPDGEAPSSPEPAPPGAGLPVGPLLLLGGAATAVFLYRRRSGQRRHNPAPAVPAAPPTRPSSPGRSSDDPDEWL